jgi:hypothetical protein
METIDFVHMEHIALGEGTKANINCLIEIVYVEPTDQQAMKDIPLICSESRAVELCNT